LKKGFKIVVLEPIHEDGIELLKKCGTVIQLPPSSSWRDLLEYSEGADAFISRGFMEIPREVLEKAAKLRVIGVHGVGVDHIDMDFAHEKDLQIVCTPAALTDTVAEFTIGLMLSLLRNIPAADAAVRKGEWDKKYNDVVGTDLTGKTVGIIGLGLIGSAVAKRLKAFNVNLVYYKRFKNIELEKKLNIKYAPFKQLLAASDIISIHVPLTAETRNMISDEEFRQMKPGVYIVNTSRGAVIDEKALYNALVSEKVAGAALDVFESEPLSPNSPLNRLDSVVLTPHLAASSKEALRRISVAIAEEITRILLNEEA
jgi:D-3-phosphoglycerate dehydrogenase